MMECATGIRGMKNFQIFSNQTVHKGQVSTIGHKVAFCAKSARFCQILNKNNQNLNLSESGLGGHFNSPKYSNVRDFFENEDILIGQCTM